VDSKLLDIVLHHHELWNGSGYPDKLKGEDIPIGSRITAVADAYSALTAWRPYREAWDRRMALSELRKGEEQGRFDPQVVQALTAMFGDFS
jgi:putative two-component system response regulator